MSYPQMKCGVVLPADMVSLSVRVQKLTCTLYLQPSVVKNDSVLAGLRASVWGQTNTPPPSWFSGAYTELISVTAVHEDEMPMRLPGEAKYRTLGEFGAAAHCMRSLVWAYDRDYRLLSFIYAPVPLSVGGIQEFSLNLPVPTLTKVPAGHFWKLLLAIEPI